VSENGSPEIIDVWVGKDGSLRKINADRQVLATSQKSTYELKSTKQSENEIREGKGSVVNSDGSLIGNKLTIIYQSIQLAYLLTESSEKYFYPVYVFEGLTSLLSSKPVKITTLLPALSK